MAAHTTRSLRIHDLLEIDVRRFLKEQASAPQWVAESLRRTPFVVVRRGVVSEGAITIGVRGALRNERWAGVCHPGDVVRVVTPPELLKRVVDPSWVDAIAIAPTSALAPALTVATGTLPALRALGFLVARWKNVARLWGPGGSVGFQMATGALVVRPESDLDVVIYADTRLTPQEALVLRDAAQGLPATVDIRVETPVCGFSLLEYAGQDSAPILLRVPAGVVLGADPWDERVLTQAAQK